MPYPTANLGFTGHIYESLDALSQTNLMKLKTGAEAPRNRKRFVLSEAYVPLGRPDVKR